MHVSQRIDPWKQGDFKPKNILYYHEQGEIYRVEILENNSNERLVDITFKILDIVRGPLFQDMPPESLERTCIKSRRSSTATWYLFSLPIEEL